MRLAARRLSERTDPFPESWRPFVTRNVQLAESALAARSLAEAARAAAGLADNCGECHAAIGIGPELVVPASQPPDAADVKRAMVRHQWAADRMWDALVAHSDDTWRAGAAALIDAPLLWTDLAADVVHPVALADLAEEVHGLGARARTTPEWPDRAALYGDLLATCAACHRGLLPDRQSHRARSPDQGKAP